MANLSSTRRAKTSNSRAISSEIIISRLRADRLIQWMDVDIAMDINNGRNGEKFTKRGPPTATVTDRTPPLSRTERRCRAAELSLEKDRLPIVVRARFRAKHRFASEKLRYSSATEVPGRNRERTMVLCLP